MAIDWNCVKRYSAPVPFGNTREYATTSIPGAGEKWKSIVWVASFVTYRIGTLPGRENPAIRLNVGTYGTAETNGPTRQVLWIRDERKDMARGRVDRDSASIGAGRS